MHCRPGRPHLLPSRCSASLGVNEPRDPHLLPSLSSILFPTHRSPSPNPSSSLTDVVPPEPPPSHRRLEPPRPNRSGGEDPPGSTLPLHRRNRPEPFGIAAIAPSFPASVRRRASTPSSPTDLPVPPRLRIRAPGEHTILRASSLSSSPPLAPSRHSSARTAAGRRRAIAPATNRWRRRYQIGRASCRERVFRAV